MKYSAFASSLILCLCGVSQAQDGVLERMARSLDNIQSQLKAAKKADRRGEPGFRALYVMKPEDATARFLFAAPGMISTATPEWSHGGSLLAFDAVPAVDHLTESKIGVYAADGPFKGQSVMLGYGNVPSWSPDDRQIAFLLNPGNPLGAPGGVWVMNADGSNRRWLCNGSYPRWSPDGEDIVFKGLDSEPPNLGFYNFKTGATRFILGGAVGVGVEFGGGTWSADCKQIYFIALKDGHQHLASVEVSGRLDTLRLIYTENRPHHELVGPPVVSPDGGKIVFAIQDRTRPTSDDRLWLNTFIYSLPLAEATTAPTLLEAHEIGLINRGMMWSPDGETITFSSER